MFFALVIIPSIGAGIRGLMWGVKRIRGAVQVGDCKTLIINVYLKDNKMERLVKLLEADKVGALEVYAAAMEVDPSVLRQAITELLKEGRSNAEAVS